MLNGETLEVQYDRETLFEFREGGFLSNNSITIEHEYYLVLSEVERVYSELSSLGFTNVLNRFKHPKLDPDSIMNFRYWIDPQNSFRKEYIYTNVYTFITSLEVNGIFKKFRFKLIMKTGEELEWENF